MLLDAGALQGERLAVQAPKCVGTLALAPACALIGAVLLPLNAAYAASDLDYSINDARPRVFVCAPAVAEDQLAELTRGVHAVLMTIDGQGGGTVEVRGPNVFQGYWNMHEKTMEEKRANGFFITGDLGELDEDGNLTIVGRAKDLIISGGFNVYPKEVEAVLDEVPGVFESAVIGVPDADMGERVVAVMVTEAGFLNSAVEDAVSALARFKQPGRYELVDALPRNTMGKVPKAALHQTYGS